MTDINKQPPKKSRKGLVAAIITASAIILILLGVIAYLLFGKDINLNPFNPEQPQTTAPSETQAVTTAPPTDEPTTEEPEFEVPDVVGMSANDAYDKLNSCGVKYTVSREYSETVAADYVISQSPQSGTVKKSERVILYISKGVDNPETTAPTTKSGKNKDKNKQSDTSNSSASSEYILAGSDDRYLERTEITRLDKQQMTLALNEIYARHGRRFSTAEIQNYFDQMSWYSGTISPGNFDESVLNKYELSNISLIVSVMEEYGYR